MKTNRCHLIATLLLGALLCACTPVTGGNRLRALDDTLKTYDRLVRWGLYDEAARYLRPRATSAPAPEFDAARYEGLRVTSLEAVSLTVEESGDEARVQNRLQYYWDHAPAVRTLTDTQTWWYDARERHWFLDGSLPAFER